ncbi:hypothetical protein K438DRAFT_1956639 [Mycena galopus ATCC 62051]|nr:hypothetical protein K438DRAFT_1956639 [Mycena galopus ATCC 62051]
METVHPEDLAEARPTPNAHKNNPFFQNSAKEEISPVDSTTSAIQEDPPAPSHTSDPQFKSKKPARPKPSLLSTILNFRLNTTPDRSDEGGNYSLAKDSKRISISGTSADSRSFPIPIPLPSIPVPIVSMKSRRPSAIIRNVTEIEHRRKFILKLAKALMTFGAPSHRIESQLVAASKILDAQAEFVQLPNLIIVTIRNGSTASTRTYFVRARGRIALSRLNAVHHVYRKVLHDKISAETGTDRLRDLLSAPPAYKLLTRCFFSFTCASILCVLSFGGSFLDMWISGCCAAVLQYLGLNAANKSAMYANVYEEIGSAIVQSRPQVNRNPGYMVLQLTLLIGVVVILPGFTVLMSALELMSKNVFCGSVRIVYAIIYTLFLGFGLTIGSDLYLVVDRRARRAYYTGPATLPPTYTHGVFQMMNGTNPGISIRGVLGLTGESYETEHVIKGCFRDPHWNWTRQPFPWWTMLFLVPLYSTASSLSNLQSVLTWNSRKQLAIMVVFSCCSYTANRGISYLLPTRPDIVSAGGAFVIGCLGNLYSRLFRGTAFTSMVTGVLFLVPSGIAQGGGLTQTYKSSADQYSSGFSLALRMITVACGVTIGLFVSQVFVYFFGTRKNAAHFAF